MRNLITKSILSVISICTFFNSFGQGSCTSSIEIVNDPALNTQYCLTNAPVTNGTLDNSNCFGGAQYDGWYDFTIASGPQTVQLDVSNYASSGGPNARNIAFEVFSGACGS